jgi:hypothetical protein
VQDGTNVVLISSDKINMEKFAAEINDTHGIWMNYPDNGKIQVHINETILLLSNEELLNTFKSAVLASK